MQKMKQRDPNNKGNSKYARKVAHRRRLAAQLGLPPNTPYPILWVNLPIKLNQAIKLINRN
jgi:hypothetical protein